ncbi:3-oxoacyl-[acyl-carrier-protein] synthase III C-terminal domain-containing protein [Streptomyces sp. FXJ1.172]|uniref:3-oxoacyl-ACP synthase III family protein n=1 Tax=Streptomyces sp. FXJ1.172 TaxID=710705 RepID=UPI0007CFB668|nr:3-oxoacyl-[acyl-carrier-protein] synthase III C-terminal domain-containing protein [Streptomyces sp. FXJ1.172]WEO93367.1 3-oxoacyl-[acyl-carrier-protein] synthase III C-terminal domain-containing protein [Streptomyces sp. FXJ1.172]
MTEPRYSTIRRVAVHVPADRQTGEEIEDEFRSRHPGVRPMPGLLRQTFGMEERRVAPADTLPSDLAAAAARQLIDGSDLRSDAVDLLIFAATSKDLEEPATAHVVADKLGVTAHVFDIQNACNCLLNALEIADALIRVGRQRRVLIVTGERGSVLSRLPVGDRDELALLLPALTLGDLGAALLLEASDHPGLLGIGFRTNSAGWRAATVSNPYYSSDAPVLSARFDSRALAVSFSGMEKEAVDVLREWGVKPDDLDLVCLHQASAYFTRAILDSIGVAEERAVSAFPHYGNVATASLPLQLVMAAREGRLRPGALVGFLGLASGASAGLLLMEWHPGPA